MLEILQFRLFGVGMSKSIETGIILLMDQVAAVIFVKKTKKFQEFELLLAAEW